MSVPNKAETSYKAQSRTQCPRRDGEVKVFIRGWIGYFRAADMKRTMKSLDEWLRRRFRMYIWKKWKKPKMKVTNLRKLGTQTMREFQTGLPAYCRKSGIEMFHYKPKTRGSWIL